jgi:uncharacterized membrane protein YukC|tara:strand:+ start:995 stop:1231 length:237 start_codon:yes stop_codon:yes gene_type:complete
MQSVVNMTTEKERETLVSINTRISVIEEVIKRLETNHLAHIEKDIARLDAKIWALISGMAIQLATFVVALLIFILPVA